MRGTVRIIRQGIADKRFIPACAGNSPGLILQVSRISVHPRVCGEQSESEAQYGSPSGSSPRVRGIDIPRFCFMPAGRFIPACAGNRFAVLFRSVFLPVHPRVCGEQETGTDFAIIGNGSSPRVRGTGSNVEWWQSDCRFIPACAGNRYPRPVSLPIRSVHPRVCGEQFISTFLADSRAGSSPRVRGTEAARVDPAAPGRFIPACAGNSRRPRCWR